MDKLVFFVPGEPKPKQSMRVGVRNGKVMRWQPKGVASYADAIIRNARLAIDDAVKLGGDGLPMKGPVLATLTMCFQWPKTWSQKKREAHAGYKTTKPDVDNLQKAIFDASQKASVFENDAQVCDVIALKIYSDDPGVLVEFAVANHKVRPKALLAPYLETMQRHCKIYPAHIGS